MTERISDRHLRPAEGVAPAGQARSLAVSVSLGEGLERTVAGQLLLTCLVNLLCRQTGLVQSVDVISPDADPLVPFPDGSAPSSLLEGLVRLTAWSTGSRTLVTTNVGTRADMRLMVGAGEARGDGVPEIFGFGHGWRAFIGRRGQPAVAATSRNPLGPFFAAALLAGEVFKAARGTTRESSAESVAHSLWSREQHTEMDHVEDGPEVAGLGLPPFYLAGLGAVGQGVMHVLGAANLADAYVVGIDDDEHDETNLNRCFLAGVQDIGSAKQRAVERFLRQTRVRFLSREMTVLNHASRPKPGLHLELADDEGRGRYRVIVSCVDKNVSDMKSRRCAQTSSWAEVPKA